jgi:hypothetical protein
MAMPHDGNGGRGHAVMDPAGQDGAAGGGGIELLASISASVGQVHEMVTAERKNSHARHVAMRQLSPVPIIGAVPLAAGAGVLNVPDMLGPHDGFHWDVRRMSVTGFSAGSVAVFINSPQDEQIANFTTAGVPVFFSTHVILNYRDSLVFVATGITGNAGVHGQAIQVPTPLLPEYLM